MNIESKLNIKIELYLSCDNHHLLDISENMAEEIKKALRDYFKLKDIKILADEFDIKLSII